MSRGNRGRVGRVGRECGEDPREDVRNKLCVSCRARGIWRTTRHTDKRAALHRGRPPADQSGKLNTEVARHADILARILARKVLSCNLSYTRLLFNYSIRSIHGVTLLTTGLHPRSRSRSHHYSTSSSSNGKARAPAGYSNSGAANTHGDSDAGQLTAS